MSRRAAAPDDDDDFIRELLSGSDEITWPDVTSPEFLDEFEERQLGPVYAIPTPLSRWNAVCGDDGGGKGLARGWFVVIGGNPSYGKALALDTPIPTVVGWTTMGEVQVGDRLFDEAGEICSVVAVREVLVGRPCYRVEFDDGSQITTDADHLWFTLRRVGTNGRRAWGVRSTWEIGATLKTADDKRAHKVPNCAPLKLPEVELDIPPYILGLWLGDGTTSGPSICTADEEIEHAVRAYAETIDCGVTRKPDPRSKAVGLTITRGRTGGKPNPFTEKLRAFGLVGNKHVPPAYLRGSVEQRLALLQGLMDTDGSSGIACEFTTTTPALRDGVLDLLSGLGFQPHLVEGRSALDGRDLGPKWRITFTAYRDRPVFRLPRKMDRQPEPPLGKRGPWRTNFRQIVAVERVESRPVRCIAVDSPSNLFLAGERMIPTHNTLLALLIARDAIRMGERTAFMSLEMHHAQLSARFYSMATGVEITRLEKGRFEQAALDEVRIALRKLFPRGGLVTNRGIVYSLRALLEQMRRLYESGVRVFLVDYLQLIGLGDEDEVQRQTSKAVICLRAFAVKFQALVIVLSQFNRATSSNFEMQPQVQGLHGGMIIEACADEILLLDHSRYLPIGERKARTWALGRKNKHGPRVDVPIEWDFKTLTIREGHPGEVEAGWTDEDGGLDSGVGNGSRSRRTRSRR